MDPADFALLAIAPPPDPRGGVTPPAIDPGLIDAWEPAIHGPGLALLLRIPGAPLATLAAAARDGHLAPLRRRALARGIPVLASIGCEDLAAAPRAAAGLGLAGFQIRGDPGATCLRAARERLGAAVILGRSCHGEPTSAARRGAQWVDYTCVAPIFPPTTAQATKRAVGLGPLRAWAQATPERPRPRIFALGGIGPATAEACLAAGAAGLAGIGLFFGDPSRVAENVAAVVTSLARPPRDVRSPPL